VILTDREIQLALKKGQITVTPGPDYNAERAIKQLTDEIVIEDSGYVLHPGIFVLGRTKKIVSLPEEARIAARVEGRSSLARLGLLIHFTAPTIHSGFNNSIRLEIINLGVVPIRLRRGIRICQLIFELTFGTPEKAFAPIQTS
jgi:dCTP deaminase